LRTSGRFHYSGLKNEGSRAGVARGEPADARIEGGVVADSRDSKPEDQVSLQRVPPPSHDERATLESVKAPREWRSVRADPTRAVPVPRFVASVQAAESEQAAGSRAPIAAVSSSPPIPAPPPVEPARRETDDLPRVYGSDRLVLLIRDPWWVYSWWELTETTLAAGRSAIGAPAALALRVYDISAIDWDGANHHAYFDIDVHDLAGNWYIELGKPGASFCAELGLRADDGRFLALVRSNVVTLPRDGMSNVVDEEWMIVEEDFRRLFDLAGGGHIGLGSGDIQRLLEQRLRSELASGGVSSFGLSSPDVRRTS